MIMTITITITAHHHQAETNLQSTMCSSPKCAWLQEPAQSCIQVVQTHIYAPMGHKESTQRQKERKHAHPSAQGSTNRQDGVNSHST
jgi:hypothetical protein